MKFITYSQATALYAWLASPGPALRESPQGTFAATKRKWVSSFAPEDFTRGRSSSL